MSGRAIKVWNTHTAQFRTIAEDYSNDLSSIVLSHDRHRLAYASNRSIRILDLAQSNLEKMPKGHTWSTLLMAWSPGGSQVASSSYTNIRVWDTYTMECLYVLERDGTSTFMTWSIDETKLVSAFSNSAIKIWNTATGGCKMLRGHTSPITGIACAGNIAWSPDGSQVAIALLGDTVIVWALVTDQLSICDSNTTTINSRLAWSPDGNQLGSISMIAIFISEPVTDQCTLNVPILTDGFLRFDSIDLNYVHTGLRALVYLILEN